MSDGNTTNPIDAAAEITDAMMSSLADVVKNAISSPEEDNSNIEQTPDEEETVDVESNQIDEQKDGEEVPDTTVDDLVAEGEAAHRSGDHKDALKSFNKAISALSEEFIVF